MLCAVCKQEVSLDFYYDFLAFQQSFFHYACAPRELQTRQRAYEKIHHRNEEIERTFQTVDVTPERKKRLANMLIRGWQRFDLVLFNSALIDLDSIRSFVFSNMSSVQANKLLLDFSSGAWLLRSNSPHLFTISYRFSDSTSHIGFLELPQIGIYRFNSGHDQKLYSTPLLLSIGRNISAHGVFTELQQLKCDVRPVHANIVDTLLELHQLKYLDVSKIVLPEEINE